MKLPNFFSKSKICDGQELKMQHNPFMIQIAAMLQQP